jgi:uncharacterized MAPEG superfamily protein
MSTEVALSLDLRWLLYSALLCLVLWVPYIVAAIGARGLTRMVGYPTGDYGDLPDWARRNYRAHMNLVESLIPFAAIVLVVHVSGAGNATTALAAQIFFWARLLHAVVMIAGLPWIRTLTFAVGWLATLAILWEALA